MRGIVLINVYKDSETDLNYYKLKKGTKININSYSLFNLIINSFLSQIATVCIINHFLIR